MDDEALATRLERLAAELEGMENLLIAELLQEHWDPSEEAEYDQQWLPPEVVADGMGVARTPSPSSWSPSRCDGGWTS